MLNHSSNLELFPEHVRRMTAELLPQTSEIKNKELWHHEKWKTDVWKLVTQWHHEKWKTDVWKLVTQWRDLLTQNQTLRVDNFQSPRANNINTLFFQTIGLKELST